MIEDPKLGALQPVSVMFPDTASMVVKSLRDDLTVDAYVAIDLSKWDRRKPSVQVIRIGGNATATLDLPELQVDVRAEYWDDAIDIMEEVRKFMGGLPLKLTPVKRVRETAGVRFLPDVGEDMPRVTCDFTVTVAST